MKKTVKFLIIFLIFIFLATIWLFYPFASSKQKIFFEVKKGQNLSEIAEALQKKGIINSKNGFIFLARLLNRDRSVQTGQFQIQKGISVAQALFQLTSNGNNQVVKVLIPEGWRLADIEASLKKEGLVVDFSQYKIGDFADRFSFLADAPADFSLEGYLFPDTYKFHQGMTDQEIILKFLHNFDRKLTEKMRQDIMTRKRTIFEIITMASIIEKEVPDPQDMKIVSGILWKRLENNIPLQVDATITYLTGKKTTKVTYKDLEVDSKYNTYKNLGLPPGPIANPGLNAILAAIYPQKTDFWYYLSKTDGETIFSKTLKEHNAAKARYLR